MKLALMSVALLAFAGIAAGQPTPQVSQRIVGDRVSGNMQIEAKSRTMIDTATLTFQNPDGGPGHHRLHCPSPGAGTGRLSGRR